MKYPDGTDIKVRDLIWWSEGTLVGHVQEIAESEEEFQSWGLDEPALFVGNRLPYDPASEGASYAPRHLEGEGVGKLNEAEIIEYDEAILRAKAISPEKWNGRWYAVELRFERGKGSEWIFLLHGGWDVIERIAVPRCSDIGGFIGSTRV